MYVLITNNVCRKCSFIFLFKKKLIRVIYNFSAIIVMSETVDVDINSLYTKLRGATTSH